MPDTDTIPVSASVASTGKGIRYIGDHAYWIPTAIAAQASSIVIGDFTTGTGYILGTFTLNGAIQMDNPADFDSVAMQIEFNGAVAQLLLTGNSALDAPTQASVEMLIPPFTNVVITVYAGADAIIM